MLTVKKNFYDNLVRKSDNVCKTTWQIINKEVGNKNKNYDENLIKTMSKPTNCNSFSDPREICQQFNNFFTTMVDKIIVPLTNVKESTASLVNPMTSGITFSPKQIDECQLDKIITSFKNKYSSGWDDIPMPIIKLARLYCLKPLVHVINSSLITGIFPEKLKISKLRPIFKSGEPQDFSNYRPLSILPSFSKIYEKVMSLQLSNFLEEHRVLDEEQYGFREGKSVVEAGIDFIESIIESVDSGEKVIGIFMDLTKAFDSVSHRLLLDMLSILGVKSRSFKWFESYLTNRKQYVEVCHLNDFNQFINSVSSTNIVKHGVPQGSILGPLLFLIYLTGLPSIINQPSKMCLYADDISIKIPNKCIRQLEISSFINLSKIVQNLHNLNLLPNSSKTKYLSFYASNKNTLSSTNICMGESILEEVETMKFLGLNIDSRLNWNTHVNQICKKISSGLYALRTMSSFSNQETLKKIYYAFIESHISFGLCLYGCTSAENLNNILLLQKRAIRIMLKLRWQDSVKEHFRGLRIMTVHSLYIYQLIVHIKTNYNNLTKLGALHKYSTRGSNIIAFERHRLQFYTKKPSYAGIQFFNHLPSSIKHLTELRGFKKDLKEFMIQKAIYSIDEFFET
uniref:Reverse transcriptase domain-containing protein n=1 Tax=Graphocephala atropunctata TaxID=36148 RepID=A0A1B6M2N5_9HEMI